MGLLESLIREIEEAFEQPRTRRQSVRITRYTVEPAPEFSPVRIKAVRTRLGMTQVTFAEVMGVSIKTVEAWEAGTNRPVGSARRLLSVLAADPEILSRWDIVSMEEKG